MKAADLIDYVASAAGVEKTAAKKAVEAVFAGIVDAAKKGEEVSLPSFGSSRSKRVRRARAAIRARAKQSRSQPRASSVSARQSR